MDKSNSERAISSDLPFNCLLLIAYLLIAYLLIAYAHCLLLIAHCLLFIAYLHIHFLGGIEGRTSILLGNVLAGIFKRSITI